MQEVPHLFGIQLNTRSLRGEILNKARPDCNLTRVRLWQPREDFQLTAIGLGDRQVAGVDRMGLQDQGTDIVADQPHFRGNVEFMLGNQVNVGIEPAQVRLLPA